MKIYLDVCCFGRPFDELTSTRVRSEFIALDDEITRRAKEFEKYSIRPFDALHLASAEKGAADVFLTTDDKFLRRAQKLNLAFEMANPLNFITKETTK